METSVYNHNMKNYLVTTIQAHDLNVDFPENKLTGIKYITDLRLEQEEQGSRPENSHCEVACMHQRRADDAGVVQQ